MSLLYVRFTFSSFTLVLFRVGISLCYMNVVIFLLFCFLRLLNRDQVVDEDAAVDDEEEDSFLKAFKVYLLYNIFIIGR